MTTRASSWPSSRSSTSGSTRATIGRGGAAARAGSTDSSATPRAGSSWSTSRPAPAHRAPRTRRRIRSWPRTRSRSRPARSSRASVVRWRGDRRRWAPVTPAAAVRVQPPLSRQRGPDVGRGAGARGGRGDGGLDVPGRGERLLSVLRGEHLVPAVRQGKAGDGMTTSPSGWTPGGAAVHAGGVARPAGHRLRVQRRAAAGDQRRRRTSRCSSSPVPAPARPS